MGMLAGQGRQGGKKNVGGSTLRENPTTQTRTEEVRGKQRGLEGPKVEWGRGKGGGVAEQESHEEWVTRREDEGRKGGGGEARGGGCFLSPFLPAHIDNQREKENIRPHDILSGSLAFPPCRVMCLLLPLPVPPPLPSLPSPALQSFDMSSPTTKTEVGRLAGATAASGCLALKLPANTAGRGGEAGGGKEREKTGGTEEGDRDRKVKKKKKAGQATLLNPWASKCVCGGELLLSYVVKLRGKRLR